MTNWMKMLLKMMRDALDNSCQWIVMNYRKQVDGFKEITSEDIWVTEKTYFHGKKALLSF